MKHYHLKETVYFRKESRFGGVVAADPADPGICFMINEATYRLLTELRVGGTQVELAEKLEVEPEALNRILDLFETAGLFVGTEAKTDLLRPSGGAAGHSGPHYLDYRYDAPLIVTLQVNTECNLKCAHCFANADREQGERLTYTEMCRLVDELAEMQVMELVLTGGEPLLYPELFPFLTYCKQKKMRTAVYSNGTLLTPETVEKLKKAGVTKVQVSIDGFHSETHDRFRGLHQAMARTVEGIRNLVEQGIYTIVNTVVTKDNLKELRDLNTALNGWGVHVHRLNRYFPIGRGREAVELAIDQQDYQAYVKPLLGVREGFKTIVSEAFGIIDGTETPNECSAGITHCSIGIYGHVVPCNYMKNNEVIQKLLPDNVKEKSFQEIWENSHLLNHIRQRDWIKPCGRCEHLGQCRAGCRTAALAEYGDLANSDPFCRRRMTHSHGSSG